MKFITNFSLELRLFLCFLITIIYVTYNAPGTEEEAIAFKEQSVEGFEIRLQNDYDNERLELTETLDQALAYLKRYSMHHEDLFVYDLATGLQVASSTNGSGAIYTGAN